MARIAKHYAVGVRQSLQQLPASDKTRPTLQAALRSTDNIERLARALLRPAIGSVPLALSWHTDGKVSAAPLASVKRTTADRAAGTRKRVRAQGLRALASCPASSHSSYHHATLP